MKMSKTSWLVIIIGVVLIALVSLGMAWAQQNTQQKTLADSLSQAKNKLSAINTDSLTAQKNQLNQQISQYKTQITEAQAKLSFPDDSIDITDKIMGDAWTNNVEVLTLSSSKKSEAELTGAVCDVLNITLSARGDIDDVDDFIYSLSKVFPTAIVKSVQVTLPGPAVAPSATPTPTPSTTPSPSGTATPTGTPTGTPSPTATPAPTSVVPSEYTTVNISLEIYNYKGE